MRLGGARSSASQGLSSWLRDPCGGPDFVATPHRSTQTEKFGRRAAAGVGWRSPASRAQERIRRRRSVRSDFLMAGGGDGPLRGAGRFRRPPSENRGMGQGRQITHGPAWAQRWAVPERSIPVTSETRRVTGAGRLGLMTNFWARIRTFTSPVDPFGLNFAT